MRASVTRRLRRISFVGVLGLALSNACSLFVDFDAYPGVAATDSGGPESGAADVSVPEPDVVVPKPDAASDGDAPSVPCLNDPTHLCDEFNGPIDSRWTNTRVSATGSIAVDDAAAVSPPSSFVSTLRDASSSAQANIVRTFGGARTGMSCTFHICTEQLGSGRTLVLAYDSRFATGNLIQQMVSLSFRPGLVELVENLGLRDGGSGARVNDLDLATAISPETFVEVTVDVGFSTDGGPAKARVKAAGIERLVDISGVPSDFTFTSVIVGIGQGAGTATIRHDDIRCEQR
jgi:hypothetical protein